jgi:two-component sensor histidine kinase
VFNRPQLAILAFVVSGVIGATATVAVHRTETARSQAAFTRDFLEMSSFVERRIAQDVAFLTATRAFLQTRAETVGRAEFETFVNGLGLGRPSIGLQGVGFALIVPPGTEAAVAAQIDAEYGTERGIWPKTDQAMRTSIVLLEPDDLRNRAAVGFDMYTEPTRRAAMIAAMTDPDAVATGPVVLVQEIGPVPQAGILIYLYLSPQGRAGEGGFVYSPIRLGDLFQAALDRAGERFDLSAIDTAAPDRPLFLSPGFDGDGGRTRLAAATTLRIATREWVLSGQAQTPFHLFRGHPFTVVTGIAAFLFALATGLAVQGLTAAIRRARALNAAQEVLMREKDLHLREMSHRLKNALARVVAMARQAARGAGTKEEYVAAMTSRLQAMADAQDMLTRAGGTADLRALIAAELAQIYGTDASQVVVSGPEVRLNPQETQALGLSFHELATNSLKYGAGATPGGRLKITWAVERKGARRELRLDWDETTGQPATPPERKGFGTQLLESCIRLDLGGVIEQRYHGSGISVRIRVPLGDGGRGT